MNKPTSHDIGYNDVNGRTAKRRWGQPKQRRQRRHEHVLNDTGLERNHVCCFSVCVCRTDHGTTQLKDTSKRDVHPSHLELY